MDSNRLGIWLDLPPVLIPGTSTFHLHLWNGDDRTFWNGKMHVQWMHYSEKLLSWLGLIIFIKNIINNLNDSLKEKRGLLWAPLIIPQLVFRTPLSPLSLAWTAWEASRDPAHQRATAPGGGGGGKPRCDPLARARWSLGSFPNWSSSRES